MQRRLGFTLIELMIVIAVLTILASIAYPSYTSYVKRSNRSAAQQLMLNISNREEQYLLDVRQYTGALDNTGLNLSQQGWSCSAATCSNDFYDIAVAADVGPPPRYTITAVAKGNQLSDGDLSLNNIGVKTGKW